MKKELRKRFLDIRSSLSKEEIESKSMAIFNALTEMEDFKNAKWIMTYIDFRDEVQTDRIINYCLQHNKRIAVPVCIPKTKELILSEIHNIDDDTEIGHFGVREPKKDKLRILEPSNISLILVPGVAFDPSGYRIGYGGGYYDRFLSSAGKGIPTIALAFECQITQDLPRDDYDIPLDYILTELRMIDCKSKR